MFLKVLAPVLKAMLTARRSEILAPSQYLILEVLHGRDNKTPVFHECRAILNILTL